MSLLREATDPGGSGSIVDITPEGAGWDWTGLRVLRLAPGEPQTVQTGESELFVLPLAGSLRVTVGGERFDLQGRESVFSRVTDFCYVGRDSVALLVSEEGAEVALPSARCEAVLPAAYGAAEDVPVEVRGAGPATRQVTNFGVPGVWDHADKSCESWTAFAGTTMALFFVVSWRLTCTNWPGQSAACWFANVPFNRIVPVVASTSLSMNVTLPVSSASFEDASVLRAPAGSPGLPCVRARHG